MDISAKVTKLEGREPLLGMATLNIGNMVKIGSISIRESRDGNIYVKMPSYKTNAVDENGKDVYKDVAYPISKEAAKVIKDVILKEYNEQGQQKEDQRYDFKQLEREALSDFPFHDGKGADKPEQASAKADKRPSQNKEKSKMSIKDRLAGGEAKKAAQQLSAPEKPKQMKAKEAMVV